MNIRIKDLRKALHLTQQEFSDKIGIKRNTLSQYEIGRNEPIDAVISLICKEFNVNENWLRTGEGDMFDATPSSTLEQLKKEFNLDDFSYSLVHEYLKLDDKHRNFIRDFFYRVVENTSELEEESLEEFYDNLPKTAEEIEKRYPPIEEGIKKAE